MNLSYGFENYSINSTSEAFVVWYINEIFTLKDGYNFNLGNPNLKPENAWSYEGTVEFYPTDGLVFLVGIFRTDATDLIENVDAGVSVVMGKKC